MSTTKRLIACLFAPITFCGLVGCFQESVPIARAAKLTSSSDPRHPPDNATASSEVRNTVNVKFMLHDYSHAGSAIKDDQAIGGFGKSDNMPRNIESDLAKSSGHCYLLAQPAVATNLAGGKGMRLVLVNGTKDVIAFEASDSRLHIVQEAKNESGTWQAIEYFRTSPCGNSYHRLFLAPGKYWVLPSPRYSGSFPTTLRFRLMDDRGKTELISNEFKGSINPEQFSVRQRYSLKDIMATPCSPVSADKNKKDGQSALDRHASF